MKQLFVIAVMILFLFSFAFAQNTSTIDESGDYNSATVTQTGSNKSTITQKSISPGSLNKANTATVTEDGVNNESVIDQDRSGGQQNHQTTAWVSQGGDNNYSWIKQDGYYQGSNSAKVTQIGINAGLGNEAYIHHKNNYGNQAEIYQDGDDNYGTQYVNTVCSGNHDLIQQYGTGHHAEQHAYGSDNQHMTAVQNNQDNYSYQYQTGLKHVADVSQNGVNNDAYQYQYHGSYKFDGSYARQHFAKSTQIGDNNYSLQHQDETVASVWDNSRNTSTIYQEGDWNSSDVYQYDGLNLGDVTQVGNHNTGNITQHTMSNTATIDQTGLNNNAQTIQQ